MEFRAGDAEVLRPGEENGGLGLRIEECSQHRVTGTRIHVCPMSREGQGWNCSKEIVRNKGARYGGTEEAPTSCRLHPCVHLVQGNNEIPC